jgi:hypothetical protein
MFVFGLLIGSGFGLYEFFSYVFVLGAPVITRIAGVFFHAASTSITSYGIVTKRPLPFYLLAVLLHFSNNFFAFFHLAMDPTSPLGVLTIGSPIVVALAILSSWKLYGKITRGTAK